MEAGILPESHDRAALARRIDHSALAPGTTREDVLRVCDEAERHGFFSVCVAPAWVSLAAARLAGARPRVTTVIAFPHGSTLSEVKAFEAERAVAVGARELDVVLNVGLLREGAVDRAHADLAAVVSAAGGALVKAILETGLLDDDEKALGCQVAEEAGAGFVKTSTGFGPRGAEPADVAFLRRCVGDRLGVKAAGGIRDLATALALLRAGADRLGCSASVAILEELGRS